MGKGISGILFDLDGTIYEGSGVIAGAREALEYCRERGIPFRFVTNTTSKPRSDVAKKLAGFGIDADPEWILTAPAAARGILCERGLTRCFLLLRAPLLADLQGISAVEDSPQAVVVGDLGGDFSHEILNRAFRFLLDPDCVFLTLARNRCYKTDDGLSMDVGAYVAALEYASGREGELIGKPAPAFFQAAVASLGLEPDQVVTIGDDLESDVLGAQVAGLRGVAVRTGKFREDQLARLDRQPDAVLDSVADLPRWITEQNDAVA